MGNGYRILVFMLILSLLSLQTLNMENTKGDLQVIQNQQAKPDTDKDYWLYLANNAWKYYQPGVGVDSNSGLHYATSSYQGFTDWDLGVYVQAIVDAARIGLITNDGEWGFDYRIDKVLTFLENRQLESNGAPYLWYSSTTGEPIYQTSQIACDAGNLLAALKAAKSYSPALANRIDNIVKTRTNYEPLKLAVDALAGSVNIYDYYVTRAFANFWPDRFTSQTEDILNNIINAPTIEYQSVALPKAKLMCEPLLLAIFEFEYDSNLMNLANKIYLAHEAKYNTTGKYAAFSEGSASGVAEYYIWEWVVTPDGDTWVIQKDETTQIYTTPIVFLKAAAGLAAIFDTEFTQKMLSDIEPTLRSEIGYYEGVSESGQKVLAISDKTNSMIITAARYAIDNNTPAPSSPPPPTSTPTTSYSSPPYSTIEPSPSPSPEQSASTPTLSPSLTNSSPSSLPPTNSPTNTPSLPQPSSTNTLLPTNSNSSTNTEPDSATQYTIAAIIAVPVFGLLLATLFYYYKRKNKQITNLKPNET